MLSKSHAIGLDVTLPVLAVTIKTEMLDTDKKQEVLSCEINVSEPFATLCIIIRFNLWLYCCACHDISSGLDTWRRTGSVSGFGSNSCESILAHTLPHFAMRNTIETWVKAELHQDGQHHSEVES